MRRTVLIALHVAVSRGDAATCESLAQLKLDHVDVVAADVVAPGGFALPAGARQTRPEFFVAFDRLPSFCRVQAVARPTADSDIRIEVWLPAEGWNGRYLGAGNGGYAGSLNYFRLGEAINAGYAASSTDTGHRGGARDRSWATGHRERQIDFDHRAIHETAQTAKAVIRAFYGAAPRTSYFSSCSNGGRQGLMEAERYPDDYDGIFAGAPALHLGFTTLVMGRLDAFATRGGRIIIYHGGNDAPEGSIAFFNDRSRRMGEETVRRFMQLYIVPGMGHCGGGARPNDIGQWLRPNADTQHSLFKALEAWVEEGLPPTGVIATRFVRKGDASSGVAATRMLRPYQRRSSSSRSPRR